jgi:hypothetical protein
VQIDAAKDPRRRSGGRAMRRTDGARRPPDWPARFRPVEVARVEWSLSIRHGVLV